MGGCWHALNLLGVPPGPDSGIKMLMFETDEASRSILGARSALTPTHLSLSGHKDSTGLVGSVLALADNDCGLLGKILDEHPAW